MVRTSYALDGVTFGEELVSYGTLAANFNVILGFINSADININDDVRQMRDIKGGVDGMLVQRNVDLLHTVGGSIETHPINFKALQYMMGSYTATTSYSIAPSLTVKSLSMKGNYDGTKSLRVTGLSITKASMQIRENEPVTINYDYVAKKEVPHTETVTGTPPTQDPLTFLSGSVTVGTKAYKINTATFDFDFGAIAKRNIEAVSTGDERVITEVIKKNFNVGFNINADLESIENEYELYTGGTSVQTARTDLTIVGTFKDSLGETHTMTITGNRGTNFKRGYRTDGEVKNFDISGVGITVSFAGVV